MDYVLFDVCLKFICGFSTVTLLVKKSETEISEDDEAAGEGPVGWAAEVASWAFDRDSELGFNKLKWHHLFQRLMRAVSRVNIFFCLFEYIR